MFHVEHWNAPCRTIAQCILWGGGGNCAKKECPAQCGGKRAEDVSASRANIFYFNFFFLRWVAPIYSISIFFLRWVSVECTGGIFFCGGGMEREWGRTSNVVCFPMVWEGGVCVYVCMYLLYLIRMGCHRLCAGISSDIEERRSPVVWRHCIRQW